MPGLLARPELRVRLPAPRVLQVQPVRLRGQQDQPVLRARWVLPAPPGRPDLQAGRDRLVRKAFRALGGFRENEVSPEQPVLKEQPDLGGLPGLRDLRCIQVRCARAMYH